MADCNELHCIQLEFGLWVKSIKEFIVLFLYLFCKCEWFKFFVFFFLNQLQPSGIFYHHQKEGSERDGHCMPTLLIAICVLRTDPHLSTPLPTSFLVLLLSGCKTN